ncbi:hypothetical protein ABFX02_08G183200 [Erythranthe guttata]
MDSRTLLDYALFQLTPTRTRCDLVIFAGKKSEKIASGLLEPFVSHLKSAKDQIFKGGYSITLKPASPNDDSSWFTKATLERFVRFVSTPEVLERFVTIEREIDQIETSIESNDHVNGSVFIQDKDPKIPFAPSKSKVESGGSGDAEAGEKPKVRLQRVLESRKAILKKEQAMAYARALVAGFEMVYIHDLVSFGDAFGALRLREACINFMELCKKKNDDKIWMDEVAVMQASYMETSGLIVAGLTRHPSLDSSEDNVLPTESNLQQNEGGTKLPIRPHHLPPYMQNAQSHPMFQQMPHYMFPGVAPPHYPWPANFEDSGMYLDRDIEDKRRQKSVNKKREKHAKTRNSDESVVETNLSISTSDTSSDEQESEGQIRNKKKQNNKRSSRKVVIRNINYIASRRNEEGSGDSDSSEQKNASSKENLVTKISEEEKNGNWDMLQNLLLKDSDSNSTDKGSKNIQFQEEGKFSYVDKKLDKSRYASDDFLFNERSVGNGVKKTSVEFEGGKVVNRSSKDEELLIPTRGEGEHHLQQNARFSDGYSVAKTRKEEDWIMRSNKTETPTKNIFNGDQAYNNHIPIGKNKRDILLDDSFMVQSRLLDSSRPNADVIMVSDILGSNQSNVDEAASKFYEPEELYMIRRNDSSAEVDYGKKDISLVDTVVGPTEKPRHSFDAKMIGDGSANSIKTIKESAKKVGGKELKKSNLGRSKSDTPSRSKISSGGSTTNKSKAEKEEEKRKKMEELVIQRQKRIAERSAAKGTVVTPETSRRSSKEKSFSTKNDKALKPQPQIIENKKTQKPVMKNSTIDRLAASRTTTKQSSNESKVGQTKKLPTSKMATSSLKKTKAKTPDSKPSTNDPKTTLISDKSANRDEDFGIVNKVLQTVTSVEKREANVIPEKELGSSKDISMQMENIKGNSEDRVELSIPGNEKKKISFSPEIYVVGPTSTPPPNEETNDQETIHSRKKWNNGESSPKVPKGFRRLLLFGRRN